MELHDKYRSIDTDTLRRMVEQQSTDFRPDALQAAIDVLQERGVEAAPPPPAPPEERAARGARLKKSGEERAVAGGLIAAAGVALSWFDGDRLFLGLIVVGAGVLLRGLSLHGKGAQLLAGLGAPGASTDRPGPG